MFLLSLWQYFSVSYQDISRSCRLPFIFPQSKQLTMAGYNCTPSGSGCFSRCLGWLSHLHMNSHPSGGSDMFRLPAVKSQQKLIKTGHLQPGDVSRFKLTCTSSYLLKLWLEFRLSRESRTSTSKVSGNPVNMAGKKLFWMLKSSPSGFQGVVILHCPAQFRQGKDSSFKRIRFLGASEWPSQLSEQFQTGLQQYLPQYAGSYPTFLKKWHQNSGICPRPDGKP